MIITVYSWQRGIKNVRNRFCSFCVPWCLTFSHHFTNLLLVNFQVLSTAIPQRASPNTFCEESPAACFKIEQKIPLQRCSVEHDYVACYIPSARLDCFYSCVMV